MKKDDKVKEIGKQTINYLRTKHIAVKSIFRCHLCYAQKKKAERLENAILRSIDTIRRSMLDDEVMHS